MNEEKERTQLEVNKKNTAAVTQTLEDFRRIQSEQQARIDGLNDKISTLERRMTDLEMLVRTHKAIMHGTGPSVK